MRFRVGSLASLSGCRIRHCRELWCRLQTRLGSGVAVAVVQASSWNSDSNPSLGTSICRGCGPKKQKNKEKQRISVTYDTPTRMYHPSHVGRPTSLCTFFSAEDLFWIKKGITLCMFVFLFQIPPFSSLLIDTHGCISCHKPHASLQKTVGGSVCESFL